MYPETLLQYTHASPFKPFRVVMNNGKHYDVQHPDFIDVGDDSVIYFRRKTPGSRAHQRWETFSLALINHIEHIEPQAAGKPRRSRG